MSYLHYVGTELADLEDDADVLRGGTDDADDAFDAFDLEGAGLAVMYFALGVGDSRHRLPLDRTDAFVTGSVIDSMLVATERGFWHYMFNRLVL